MAEQTLKTSSGVHDLVTRLRDEGVQAGRSEADRLVADAKRQAAQIVEEARAEAAALQESTRVDVEKEKEAAMQALRLAARDAVLELREGVSRHFERHVKRLVSQMTVDEEFIRALVLVLAGRTVGEFVQDKDAEVLVAAAMGDAVSEEDVETARARTRDFILGITGNMLREGVELLPDSEITGGARVRVKGEHAEIDLSDATVTALLMKNLLPRFQAILDGSEV